MSWDHHHFRFSLKKKKGPDLKNIFGGSKRMLLVTANGSGEKTALLASNDATPQ